MLNFLSGHQIILASMSPRRAELMKSMGLQFRCMAPNLDETARSYELPGALTRRLAHEKASCVATFLDKKGCYIVIAADTIVVNPVDKKILGKPTSKLSAKRMLRALSGRTHIVFTSFVILKITKGIVKYSKKRTVKTQVTMMHLTEIEIDNYIKTDEPIDKAGAYAAQGKGMVFIKNIKGSYTNIIGLPTVELSEELRKIT